MAQISLVMATLGRKDEIDRCVDSLANQTCKDFELIVVDQNQDDRLVKVVARARALGLVCKHLRQAVPNLCMARNAGIAVAEAEIIGFPDDDCWYEKETVELLLSRFSIAPKLDGLVICWKETGEVLHGSLSLEQFRAMRRVGASSICLFFKAGVLRKAEGFDLTFGLHSWYGSAEETDLILRVLTNGGAMEYAPTILVHHAVHQPGSSPVLQSFRHARRRARGTGGLYARHKFSIAAVCKALLSPWVRAAGAVHQVSRLSGYVGKGVGMFEGYFGWFFGYRVGHKIN